MNFDNMPAANLFASHDNNYDRVKEVIFLHRSYRRSPIAQLIAEYVVNEGNQGIKNNVWYNHKTTAYSLIKAFVKTLGPEGLVVLHKFRVAAYTYCYNEFVTPYEAQVWNELFSFMTKRKLTKQIALKKEKVDDAIVNFKRDVVIPHNIYLYTLARVFIENAPHGSAGYINKWGNVENRDYFFGTIPWLILALPISELSEYLKKPERKWLSKELEAGGEFSEGLISEEIIATAVKGLQMVSDMNEELEVQATIKAATA